MKNYIEKGGERGGSFVQWATLHYIQNRQRDGVVGEARNTDYFSPGLKREGHPPKWAKMKKIKVGKYLGGGGVDMNRGGGGPMRGEKG